MLTEKKMKHWKQLSNKTKMAVVEHVVHELQMVEIG